MTPEQIEAAYPDGPTFFGYDDMVIRIGEVLAREDDGDYQGDTYALVKGPDGRIGFVSFSWGSCSGCDALQACDTYQDVADLFAQIRDSVRWFRTLDEAKAWVVSPDQETQHQYHTGSWGSFVASVVAL